MMGMYQLVLTVWIYIWTCISIINADVILTNFPDDVFENTSLTLTCQYNGALQVDGYNWRKNDVGVGVLVYNVASGCVPFRAVDTTLYTYSCPERNRATLTILKVTQSNNGERWTCEFTLSDGTRPASNEYTITVKVPVTSIEITEPTSTTVSVQENTNQVFKCRTSTSRPTAEIQWYLDDGTTTTTDTMITDNVQQTPAPGVNNLQAVTGTLTYRPTRQVNGWQLYCSAQNLKSSMKVLNITYPPNTTRIDTYPKDSTYSVIAGQQQRLTCRSIDGNPLATLRWSCFTGTSSNRVSGTTVTSEWMWTTNTGGQCTCESEQMHGNQRYSLNVEILVAVNDVKFHISNQEVSGNVKVINDSTVPIVCSASGSPTITFRWTQGVMVVVGNRFVPNNILQDGTYTCSAYNTLNPTQGQQESHSSSSSVDIIRLYPSTPEIRYGDANGPVITEPLRIVKGQQFQLHCHASSSPASSYTWSRGNYNGAVLTVSSSNDEQGTCTATTTMVPTVGSTTTKSTTAAVSIQVLKPPTIPVIVYHHSSTITMDNVDNISVIQGNLFNISCSSTGQPTPSVSWTSTITSNTKSFVSISKNEAGIYSCMAQNGMNTSFDGVVPGTTLKNLSINVLYKPDVHSLADITLVEGSSPSFPVVCLVTPGNPQQTLIKWTKDGVQKSSTNRVTSLELPLNNVNKNQDGTYTCTAENSMNPTKGQTKVGRDSKQFQLTVHYPTSIDQFEELDHPGVDEVTVTEIDKTQLKCLVDSKPGSTISIKQGQVVKRNGLLTKELSYTIQKATCQDTGIYTCVGYNDEIAQTTRPSKSLQLYVKCSPRLSPINETESNQTSTLNTTAALEVYMMAYPAPKQAQLQWKKKNGDTFTVVQGDRIETEFSTSGIFTRASILIHDVQQSDFGEYLLYVRHEVSDANFTLFFNAKAKPSSPTNTGVEKVTTTSAVIYWYPGFDGGSVQTFIIMYRKEGESVWSKKEVDDNKKDQMDIVVDKLESGARYIVRIYALNELGNSTAKQDIYFTTVVEVSPPGVPAAAIGGAVGGCLVVIVVVVLIVFIIRRRQVFKGCKNCDTESKHRNLHEASKPQEDVSYYNTRSNPHEATKQPEDVSYYNIGRDIQVTDGSNNGATNYNGESFRAPDYESLNNQTRDVTTYSTLQPVRSNERRDNTCDESKTYENLKLRVI